MNEGLMIGKFAPLTNGHLTAFSMALSHCYQLTVLVCIDHLHDPECNMTPEQRVDAVRKECRKISGRIIVREVDCTSFPYAKEDNDDVSKYWAQYLQKEFPNTTTLFGSEEYVAMMAKHWPDCMGVDYKILDKDRKTTHISATMVRENPRQYWEYIPASVKPFFTKNVLVLGAESCGKTTLTRALGKVFHAPVVPEMYRSIFPKKGMDFTADDLGTVSRIQAVAQHEANLSFFNKGVVFHDTCCDITLMYGEEYFPSANFKPVLENINREVKFDLILFCDIDVPWENDGTRTLGNEDRRIKMRDKAYSIAIQKAKRHGCEVVKLQADYKRLPEAIEAIEGIL